jgi:hypothetical protein
VGAVALGGAHSAGAGGAAEAVGAGAAFGLITILGDPAGRRAAGAAWVYHLPAHDNRSVVLAFTLLVIAFCRAEPPAGRRDVGAGACAQRLGGRCTGSSPLSRGPDDFHFGVTRPC